jgi:serine/threonine protein kinase
MKILTCVNTGQSVTLVKQIATSGEGEVWQTDRKGYLAKTYYTSSSARIRKLEVMVAHPPIDPNAQINHISFAWPQSLLKNGNGNSVGFLMPEIANSVGLLDVYNPQRRQKVLPGFNWLYLHTTAMNIASIVWAIHKAGYVLGDIKPQNILVNNQALPAVIDTDSFQVRHPQTGELYYCPVGSEGFTPVELLGKNLAIVEQTAIHDRFRLAVIIFLLLFGDHPFKGKWIGAGDSPEPNELLRQGFWPYAANSLIQSGPLTIPLTVVHPEIQNCFLRCFNTGHTQPELRPTPEEWVKALKAAIAELKVCSKVKIHCYSETYGQCYWCERKALLGVDIFPIPGKKHFKSRTATLPNFKAATETLKKRLENQTSTPSTYSGSDAFKTIKIRLSSTGNSVAEKLAHVQNQLQEKLSTVRSQSQSSQSQFQSQITQPKASQPKPSHSSTARSHPVISIPIAKPKPSQVHNSPSTNPASQMPSLSLKPGNWVKPGIALAIISVVLVIPILLRSVQIDGKALESKIFGLLLCTALVCLGFRWLRGLDKKSS